MRHACFVNAGTDAANTVLLAGSGRSGTTWLAELLNHDNRFRYMFEPFWGQRVRACRDFNVRQYLRPGDAAPRLGPVADRIVSGRLRARWVDRFNRKVVCRERLIKDIRVNLMLGWLRQRHPGMKTVFLLRHPAAVALSRMRLGWQTHLDEILSQEALVDEHLAPFLDGGAAPADDFEEHLWLWCIENRVPLTQPGAGAMHVMLYERLCVDPEGELHRLFDFLGLGFDRGVVDGVRRPSKMADGESAVVTGEDLVGKWRRKLTAARLDRLEAVLGNFGLDGLYTADPMPRARNPVAALTGTPAATSV